MFPIQPQPASIALQELECDPDQVRADFSTMNPPPHLLVSISRFGLLSPLLVLELAAQHYLIVDGHYRYACAKMLGLTAVPCLVYPKGSLRPTDIDRLRYDLHDLDQPWQDSDFYRWRSHAKADLSPKDLAEVSYRFGTRYHDPK